MVGEVHQYPARGASLYVRLHQRVVGHFAPHGDERVPEPLGGQAPPFLAQIG